MIIMLKQMLAVHQSPLAADAMENFIGLKRILQCKCTNVIITKHS